MGLLRRILNRRKRSLRSTPIVRETVSSEPRPVSAPSAPEQSEPEVLTGLVLYKFDACPYCARVQREIERLGLSIEQRDTRQDRTVREDLRRRTGRTQVPCLFIENKAMFESLDIIDWLRDNSEDLREKQ